MIMAFNPKENYSNSQQKTGYVPRKEATQKTYDRLGFMSGLEVHQQLLTREKLFCHCPAGIYNSDEDYDAELIRHMRPTLSELGEYDGTALMEFKTRKEIVYRINNENACTYEIDDTPPFPLNREALDIAIEISLLCKLNIVGEVHITRKQYLDGSIPTGFQRTAIVGVEGSLQMLHKKIRLIQLSIEEDACREISDIGHRRIYKTDRLGMPLIETVTYPDCVNPDEVKEACNTIRFLNRSTGKVRTGIGAGRQDVNVSCKGGSRVEIKGVAHSKWIPELTHNEVFRQWALLQIKKLLNRKTKLSDWNMKQTELNGQISHPFFQDAEKIIAVNLPHFKGILSHFTQPGHIFADELSGRLKVIACLEHPNLLHSEMLEPTLSDADWKKIQEQLGVADDDAQLLIWGREEDMPTALETIDERCRMAFEGVPKETRKSLPDGTTIFERVLPGADRMYPDTDSAPIPLEDSEIEALAQNLPEEIIEQYHQLKAWGVPEDCFTFLFSKNLFGLMRKITASSTVKPAYLGIFLGEKLKFALHHYPVHQTFDVKILRPLFQFLKKEKLDAQLAEVMLPVIVQHPKMEFESVLTVLHFKHYSHEALFSRIPLLIEKIRQNKGHPDKEKEHHWVMGQLRQSALGNIALSELSKKVKQIQNKR
jgi:glutamyl-tRNA(Gln) amidotransferase subunit E